MILLFILYIVLGLIGFSWCLYDAFRFKPFPKIENIDTWIENQNK